MAGKGEVLRPVASPPPASAAWAERAVWLVIVAVLGFLSMR